ncbi:hypothetical protein Hs30E_16670 [Lactococcus hodotermopsidis]|uniref:Uncharacterized protein n=1 Tax=Pseudolactococcus hodotermopsidis TaxID=2709157 RepID=A0A6A0BE93_9LACT|nr:hypothetical protein [Lactococcus hodotermopsidis]GFH43116.1 hypothetical protein Hs30E_16670 [Lactococcus hodotermopsidis]
MNLKLTKIALIYTIIYAILSMVLTLVLAIMGGSGSMVAMFLPIFMMPYLFAVLGLAFTIFLLFVIGLSLSFIANERVKKMEGRNRLLQMIPILYCLRLVFFVISLTRSSLVLKFSQVFLVLESLSRLALLPLAIYLLVKGNSKKIQR